LSEGILHRKMQERGLERKLEVDSFGTGSWRQGEQADPRTEQTPARYSPGCLHTTRQVRAKDLTYYDHVLVMDKENLCTLEQMFPQHRGRARLLLDLNGGGEVPGPSYGSLEHFEARYRV
jgi:protein-tyrosine phosphatase